MTMNTVYDVDAEPELIADPVERALTYAFQYGQIDGSHHRKWVIDQIVRALTNCPVEENTNCVGDRHNYWAQGESPQYIEFIRLHNDGEDGPNTYTWECSIAP